MQAHKFVVNPVNHAFSASWVVPVLPAQGLSASLLRICKYILIKRDCPKS
jgi:hypothetical protein